MMEKLDVLNQVAAFHKTFKHPIETKPTIPSAERCQLRVALLSEELKELEQAIIENNLIEIADAICDLQYVLSGAVLEFGLGEKFASLFAEVQRSNMSKACKTLEEAEATVKYYTEERNTPCYFKEHEGLFLVYRSADNKTLKSINYSPADLATIVTS